MSNVVVLFDQRAKKIEPELSSPPKPCWRMRLVQALCGDDFAVAINIRVNGSVSASENRGIHIANVDFAMSPGDSPIWIEKTDGSFVPAPQSVRPQ